MEFITDADYARRKRLCKDFEIKHSGDYHDLYIQGDTLMLADVFENFDVFDVFEICLEI